MNAEDIMANRPFADGDWIYFKAYTGKAVVIAYDTERGKVYAKNGHVFNQDDISYIRTPRKGSKEARDICAMLLWTHRRQVQFYIFVACGFERPIDDEAIKQRYKEWKETKLYGCYQKAKSMLN